MTLLESVLANSKTQNAFLFTVHAIFRHDYPLAVEPAITPKTLVQKKTLRDSVPIDMLPCLSWLLRSRVRKFRRGLMNNPVCDSLLPNFYITLCFIFFSLLQILIFRHHINKFLDFCKARICTSPLQYPVFDPESLRCIIPL